MAESPEIRLREHPRAVLATDISIRYEGRPAPLRAMLVNASSSGLGISCREPLAEGTSLSFQLDTGAAAVSGEGRVVWSQRQRRDRSDMATLGVQIVALAPPGSEHLTGLVERHRRRHPPLGGVEPAETEGASQRQVAAGAAEDGAARAAEDVAAGAAEDVAAGAAEDVAAGAAEDGAAGAAEDAPVAGAGGTADRPNFPRLFLIGFAALLVVIVAGLALGPWMSRDRLSPEPAPPPARAAASSEPAAEAASTSAEPAAESVPTSPSGATDAEAPSPAAPAPPPPSPGPAAPPTAVRTIAAEARTGGTRLRITADRPISLDHVFATPVATDPPRYLLRIAGVRRREAAGEISVGSAEVVGVRTGLHETPRGPEIHIVVDLVTRELDVALETRGEVLSVDFAARR